MSVGDYIGSIETVSSASTLNIQSSSGDQSEIHMIKAQYSADLKVSDSVTDSKVESLTGGISYEGLKYEVSNNWFLKVENSVADSNVVVYRGVKTKE